MPITWVVGGLSFSPLWARLCIYPFSSCRSVCFSHFWGMCVSRLCGTESLLPTTIFGGCGRHLFCHLYGQHILSEPLVFRGSLFLSTVGGVCPKSAFLAVCCMPSTLSSYTCLMGVTLPFGQVYAMVCLVCTFWLGPLCVHVISPWPAGLFLSLGVGWMLRGAVF